MVRLVIAVLAALPLTTATAHANAIAVSTQPDLVAGVEFQIAAVWSTPAAPSGFVGVTVKPSGPGCAPNFKADFKWETPGATGDDAIWTEVVDTGHATGAHQEAAPGSYTICGYLQNSEDSETPDAMTGPVLINLRGPDAAPVPAPPPDPCPAARVALERANQAVVLDNTYVKRFRGLYRRYVRVANRSTGLKRTRALRLANAAEKRYRASVRARKQDRSARTKALAAVGKVCPK
jgi:hypothetical protein